MDKDRVYLGESSQLWKLPEVVGHLLKYGLVVTE